MMFIVLETMFHIDAKSVAGILKRLLLLSVLYRMQVHVISISISDFFSFLLQL